MAPLLRRRPRPFLKSSPTALPAAILASAYYEEIQKKNFLVSFEAIASVPLFQELPIGAVGKINEKLQVVLVSEHETIFSKGEEADSMFIIEYGKVKVEIEQPVYLVSGDYFGEMGLLGNAPRNATITAADDTKLLELTIKNPIAKLRGYCVGTNIPREKEMMQKIFKLTKRKVSANDFYDLK